MDIILAIMYVAAGLGYVAMGHLAIRGYFILRRLQNQLHDMDKVLAKVYAMQCALQLKNAFDAIAEMKADMEDLLERDEFEAARELQLIIKQMEKATNESLERFKNNFGDAAVVIGAGNIKS